MLGIDILFAVLRSNKVFANAMLYVLSLACNLALNPFEYGELAISMKPLALPFAVKENAVGKSTESSGMITSCRFPINSPFTVRG